MEKRQVEAHLKSIGYKDCFCQIVRVTITKRPHSMRPTFEAAEFL